MPRSHSLFPELSGVWLHQLGGVEVWQLAAVVLQFLVFAIVYALLRVGVSRALKFRPVGVDEATRRKNRKQLSRSVAAIFAGAAAMGFQTAGELSPILDHPVGLIFRFVILVGIMLLAYALWDMTCDNIVERSDSKKTAQLLVPITRKLVRSCIVLVGGLVAMGMVGVDIAGVVAGLGITGIVVALAAKDSVENVFGSITIMFDMPFTIGDWVKIDKVEGVVEEINLRSTRIRTFEDTVINLPNANLIRASVENFGLRRSRRQRISLRFDYSTPLDHMVPFIAETRAFLETEPGVLPGKNIVALNDFADANIGVFVQFFIEADSQAQELEIRERVMVKLLELATEHQVQMSSVPVAAKPARANPERT